jgi:hypothetical protein
VKVAKCAPGTDKRSFRYASARIYLSLFSSLFTYWLAYCEAGSGSIVTKDVQMNVARVDPFPEVIRLLRHLSTVPRVGD